MEEWKGIKGYEGLYQVSNYGRVKSLYFDKEKILSPTISGKGYLQVVLYKNKQSKKFYVHILVAIAFIPNPHNLPEVNHQDENKSNNAANNLEWCTHKYNANYGTKLKRTAEKHCKKILQYDLQDNFIKEWESIIQIEKQLKIFSTNIAKCCRRKVKTAGGYIWRYKDTE